MSGVSQPIADSLLTASRAILSECQDHALDFNIFDLLDRATDEVKGHSAFICELLDPHGSHGKGDIFLKRFLRHVGQLENLPEGLADKLDGTDWTVGQEEWFSNQSASGRIDIIIQNPKVVLIIENKIYAGDQYAQLKRYSEYGKPTGRKAFLFYLTRDGSKPGIDSIKGMSPEQQSSVILLSYCGFIKNWIEDCIKEIPAKNHLSETLVQYARLVFRLGNSEIAERTLGIMDTIRTPEDFGAALEIGKALAEIKIGIQFAFWEELKRQLEPSVPVNAAEGKLEPIPKIQYSYELVRKYYTTFRSPWYGMNLPLKKLDNGSMLIFYIGLPKIYYGFYLHNGQDFVKFPSKDTPYWRAAAEIDGGNDSDEALGGKWWRNLPELDFWEFNPDCLKLMDRNKIPEIVKQVSTPMCAAIEQFTKAIRNGS